MIKVPLWLRDLLKRDGSRELTADWDIGNGRMIQADKIRARDGDGLALYEDGGKGIFVKDGGNVGIGGTAPVARVTSFPTASSPGAGIDSFGLVSSGTYGGGVGWLDGNGNFGVWLDTAGAFAKFGFGTNLGVVTAMLSLADSGRLGIMTQNPANTLAVNRQADDGVVVDIEQADAVEGTISVSGNTVSYNAFMGSHYTQLKVGQKTPPVGAIVIATGEIISCEANIEVPTMERYYEDEKEVSVKEGIEDDIVEKQVDTGREQDAYVLIDGKIIKTKIPILEMVKINRGMKLRENCWLDRESGKLYRKFERILKDNENPPENVTISERPKMANDELKTEIEAKDVTGIERKEYFSYIELASQKADKRVYGVYHAKMCDNAKGQSFGEDDKPIHQIAAVGLYKVRVTDTNGNIEAGDYIQSSIRSGEGERQDDAVLHNYTVAKSIIDVDWDEVEVDLQLGYKWKLIPATLHAG